MVETYTYNNQLLEYKIVYKKRKTIGIYFDEYGQIELRVPKDISLALIRELLESKWDWIIQKQLDLKEQALGSKVRIYENGEQYLYMGKSYPIHIIEESDLVKDYIRFDKEHAIIVITVKTNEEKHIKALIRRYYYKVTKSIVEERIRFFQKDFKVKPRNISISNNEKTWGTCNGSRELTFNWRLAMAPLEVIDYIIIHEMCHMVHLNHDRSFWRLVGKYIPNYEEHQSWLAHSIWQMTI